MIIFQDVSKRYDRKLAVDGLQLTIPAGELFAFLGPNGAGKTTTIKTLVGLLRPTHGSVRVAGYDVVRQHREAMALIGYVPDEPFLYDKLTGREFLEFVAQMRGLNAERTAARIARECEQFNMGSFLDDLVETYSHGMCQRVVFASALLHDPPVLVVDEPTVGLDPKTVRLVKDLLRQRAAAGTSVFMSTHSLAIAEEIADRIGIIHHGRLCFLGTRQELQEELARNQTSLEQLFLERTEDGPGPVEAMSEPKTACGEPSCE